MTTFLKLSKFVKIDRNWSHIRRIGLRIKHFESQRCCEFNGTTGDPQNCHIKFKIKQKSNGPHREKCTLNYSVNRILLLSHMHAHIQSSSCQQAAETNLAQNDSKQNDAAVQKTLTTFLKNSEVMKICRNWTHIRRIGLRIKESECTRC